MNFLNEQGLTGPKEGPNPSRATRQTLASILKMPDSGMTANTFCDGVFEPGFDPRAYEAKTTILNPGIRVRYGAWPDIRIEYPESEPKLDCIPVLDSENRELCMSGASS